MAEKSRTLLRSVLLVVFSVSALTAHKKPIHQYISREAFNLLKKSFPTQLSEMEEFVGTNEVWSGGSADGSFGALRIVSGAWLEDEYDVVYHYGLLKRPIFDQWNVESFVNLYELFYDEREAERVAFTSATHFWDADGGLNSGVTLTDVAYIEGVANRWSFSINENSAQKIQKYADGLYDFLWAYNGGRMSWTWCGIQSLQLMTKFDVQGVIDFYGAKDSFKANSYIAEDGFWYATDCPEWDPSYTSFHKAHAYELLGRMAHLIQDQSLPAHAHSNAHACIAGMYCDYYEENAPNYHMWTGDEIFASGQTFINPYNNWGDSLYYLMYLMNQAADHYASGRTDGDDNFDASCPGLSDIIATLGLPVTKGQINDANIRAMHDKLFPLAIRATAGLLFWVAVETGMLSPGPPPVAPQNFTLSNEGGNPRLRWNANSEAVVKGYNIYKKVTLGGGGGSNTFVIFTTDTTYLDTDFQIERKRFADTAEYWVKAVDVFDQESPASVTKTATGTSFIQWRLLIGGELPDNFKLRSNHPNPFNPVTTIKYDIPENSLVTLKVYDLMGHEVTILVNGSEDAGYKSSLWDGKDSHGNPVSSGMYLYRLDAISRESDKEFHMTRKMVLLR